MRKASKWKWLFLFLLGLNIFIIVFVFISLKTPTEKELPSADVNLKEYIPLLVSSNKGDLNQLINQYIEEEGLNKTVDYQVLLADSVVLDGVVKVFGQEIELKMTFEPEVVDDGNLILRQKTMSIGRLPIPPSYVLEFIKGSYDLPGWVTIQPGKELVHVQFDALKLKNESRVKMNTFDLQKDLIQFTLLVPNK